MKCLFVAPGLGFGGAERVMSILANEWHERGDGIRFLLTYTPAESCYKLNEDIEIISCNETARSAKIAQLAIIKVIRKECIKWKPDVVISFFNDVCALTAVALIGLHIPLIYSERNDPNKVNQRFIDKAYRKIVEYSATKFVFQTEGAKLCYPRKVQSRSKVILNPMDLTGFPLHDFDNEEKIIVSVGRLEPQKNQSLLIEAFSMVKAELSEYSLIIYGEGSLRKRLEEKIQFLKLQTSVFLPGSKTGIQNHIKNASLFVLSSDYEGIPNALIEAMAIGLPCVTTDCSPGGARALIDDRKNGLIVPCDDSQELADGIKKMIADRDFAKQCGNNACEIRKLVNSAVIAEQWRKFICE